MLGFRDAGRPLARQLEEMKCVYVGGVAYAVFIAPLKMRERETE